MYQFKNSNIRDQFYKERLEERSDFIKKFFVLITLFAAVYTLNDILFAINGLQSWLSIIPDKVMIFCFLTACFGLSRIKCVKRMLAKLNLVAMDTIIFLIFLLLQMYLAVSLSASGVDVAKKDGVRGFFFGNQIAAELIWTLYFVDFLVTSWMYRLTYFASYWLVLFVRQAQSNAAYSELFSAVRILACMIILVILQERSVRIAFVTKKKSQEKIELFEHILKQIHEDILVFDLQLGLKYSNIYNSQSPTNFPDFTLSSDSNTCADYLINSICDLQLSHVAETAYPTKIIQTKEILSTPSKNTLSLFLKNITTNRELFDELCGQEFLALEGRIINQNRFFAIQVVGKTYLEEECIVVIIKDITHNVTILREKNEVQSNILSSLSHELITPLGITRSLLEAAIQDQTTTSKQKTVYLGPALNYSQLLTYFISDVLDFVKMQKEQFILNLKVFCMESLLDELVNLIKPAIDIKRLSIKFDYDQSKRSILKSDPERVKQVLINILNNAVKYTMEGCINVTFRVVSSQEYLVNITDTGIGLKVDELLVLQKKISENKFSMSVNRNSTGAGIGLIVSNALLKHLNPSSKQGLRVHSEFDVGTTFSVSIENQNYINRPIRLQSESEYVEDSNDFIRGEFPSMLVHSKFHSSRSDSPSVALMRNPSSSFGKDFEYPLSARSLCQCRKILVVDDEVFNTVAVEMIAKTFGFDVESVFNGREALARVQRRNAEKCGEHCSIYDMIVMDCNMPIMDGYAATQAIREKISEGVWSNLVIVGCTAYEGAEKLEQCITSGMDTYVKKPLSKNKFIELLDKFNIKH